MNGAHCLQAGQLDWENHEETQNLNLCELHHALAMLQACLFWFGPGTLEQDVQPNIEPEMSSGYSCIQP